nr:ABC transporter permease [Geobacteraceae bacterium]
MEIFQSAKIAFRALRVNKTRSFLTMLGIIIGIAAVIVMVAIGSGARTIIAEQISSVGSNILLVIPGSTTSGGIRVGAGSTMSLTYEDAEAVQNECPSVYLVSPIIRGTAQVVYGNQNWSTLIMGSTPAMIEVREWPLVA